jgi:hypothetical protein
MAECSRREEVQWMNPKSINYTEEKVQYYFQRGAPRTKREDEGGVASRPRSDESLQSMFRRLKSGELQVAEIPRIRVIRYNGSWYTFDNKRLWVFRQYGAEDILVQIVDRPTNLQLAKLHEREGEERSKIEEEGGCKEPEIIDKESEKRFQGHEFVSKQDLLSRILKWSIRDLLGSRPPEEVCVRNQDSGLAGYFLRDISMQLNGVASGWLMVLRGSCVIFRRHFPSVVFSWCLLSFFLSVCCFQLLSESCELWRYAF